MQSSGNKSGMSLVLEMTVVVATIAAGVAAVIALKDKGQIIAIGVICGFILGGIALHIARQGNRGTAVALISIAVLVMAISVLYGQSIDVSDDELFTDRQTEQQTTTPQPADSIGAANDVFIDQFNFARQQKGYLLSYTGNPNDAEEECKELMISGKPQLAMLAIINQSYCAETSDGRVAHIQIRGDIVARKVTSISYTVWNP